MDRRHFATRLSIFAAAFVPAAVRGQKPTMTIPGNKQVIGEGQNKDQPGIYGVNLHGGDGVDGQSDSGNGVHGSANKLFNGSGPWDYLMFTRLSSELSIISFLIVFTAGTVSAQRVDYEKREIQASPQVKQKLADFRSRIQVKKLRYKVAYTEVFEAPIASLTGLIVPKNLNTLAIKQNAFARQRLKADDAAKAAYEKRIGKSVIEFQLQATPQSTFFDWRQQGIVTDVKNQNPCGSCWDFGALAAYDSSYQRRNGVKLSLSEQEILDCSKAGTCKGGWHTTVFDYLIGNGGATDASYTSYSAATNPTCSLAPGFASAYRAVAWGYVTTDTIPGTPNQRMSTVAELKKALLDFGPLTVTMMVTDEFQAYKDGVFEEHRDSGSIYTYVSDGADNQNYTVQSDGTMIGKDADGNDYYPTNHAILLIGWDDTQGAWLIKNSWGQGWGNTGGFGTDTGYGWVKYNADNIGWAAAWVKAQNERWPVTSFTKKVVLNGPIKTTVDPNKTKIQPIIPPNPVKKP